MKKTLLASTLILLSSNAMASDIFSSYEKKASSIEISAINYGLDVNVLGQTFEDKDQVGGKIKYQSLDSLNFGYQISHEGFNYDEDGVDLTMQLSTLGVNYQLDLFSSKFYLKPEIGVYHFTAKLDEPVKTDDGETNGYGKMTLGGNLVDNKLDMKLYYTYYEHDSEEFDQESVGVQLNYHFNRDFDLFINYDEFGEMKMYGVGIAIKYF